MRVLHLRSSGGFYGAENVIIQLASRQQDSSISARVGILGVHSGESELFKRCGAHQIDATIIDCQGMGDRHTLGAIRRILKTDGIDILCAHDYKSTILGYLASLGLDVKRVSVNHLWDDIDFKLWVYQRAEGVLYNLFDHVVAVSEPVAADVGPFLLNKQKLTVISNGIDTDYYADFDGPRTLRGRLGVGEGDTLVGVVGRLAPQKGHTYLIDAASHLIKQHSHLKFVFWGKGPLEEELKQQVSALELENNILFAGTASNMPEVYREMDILAMPSLAEGLPMALLEAMAAGVLVMVTPVGDVPTVVRDGENGFLVPPKDVAALRETIQRILEMGDGEKKALALKGQQYIRDHLSADVMARKYHELFVSLCSRD